MKRKQISWRYYQHFHQFATPTKVLLILFVLSEQELSHILHHVFKLLNELICVNDSKKHKSFVTIEKFFEELHKATFESRRPSNHVNYHLFVFNSLCYGYRHALCCEPYTNSRLESAFGLE